MNSATFQKKQAVLGETDVLKEEVHDAKRKIIVSKGEREEGRER